MSFPTFGFTQSLFKIDSEEFLKYFGQAVEWEWATSQRKVSSLITFL